MQIQMTTHTPCQPTTQTKNTTMNTTMKQTHFFKALYDRLTPDRLTPCCREMTDMKRTTTSTNLTATQTQRAQRLLAKVRQRQLDLAMSGRVEDSARYAKRASRVRQQAAELTTVSPCCAA